MRNESSASAAARSVEKPSFLGLDAVKMIAAVLVVGTHSQILAVIPAPLAGIINVAIALAVPFFFIASGFLCFFLSHSKHDEEIRRTRKAAHASLWLYAAWTIVYLPASIASFVVENAGFTLKTILRYVHKVVFVGEWQLWFLLSMAIGYAAIHWLLCVGVSRIRIFMIGVTCYVISCVIEVLQGAPDGAFPSFIEQMIDVYDKVFASPRVLLQGISYIAVGMMMAYFYEKFYEILWHRRANTIGLLLVGIVLWVLNYKSTQSTNILISICLCGLLRFLLAIIVSWVSLMWVQVDYTGVFRYMRTVSAVMYLAHMYFLVVFTLTVTNGISMQISALPSPSYNLFTFFLAIVGCFVVSIVVNEIGERSAFISKLFHC